MCKVSTLRPVQPASLKCLQSSKLLPKIDEAPIDKVPVEYAGLLDLQISVSLPSLVKNKSLKSASSAKERTIPKKNESVLKESVEIHPVRRLSDAQRSPQSFPKGSHQFNENLKKDDSAAVESHGSIGKETKLLQRKKLQKSLSVPLMNKTGSELTTEASRDSFFPLEGNRPLLSRGKKTRPATPFVLSRTHSGGHRKLQAWTEDTNEKGPKESSEFPLNNSAYQRSIDRDKVQSGSLPRLSGVADAKLDVIALPNKIKMDALSFKQWIMEQRSS